MAFVFNNGVKLLNGSYWTTNTIKAMLVGAAYVANRDDVFVSAIGSSEVSGSGYSRGFNSPGRKTLSTKTVVVDNTNNQVNYGAANLTWSSISAGGVLALVLIEEKTTDADSLLLAYIDAPSVTTTNGSNLPALFQNGLCFSTTN